MHEIKISPPEKKRISVLTDEGSDAVDYGLCAEQQSADGRCGFGDCQNLGRNGCSREHTYDHSLTSFERFCVSVCFNTHIVTQKNTQYKAHCKTFFVPEYKQKSVKSTIICTCRKNFAKKQCDLFYGLLLKIRLLFEMLFVTMY